MIDEATKDVPTEINLENNNNNNNKTSQKDLISLAIGDIGKWQLYIGTMMALLKIPIAIFQFNIVMIAAKQNYWCEKWKNPTSDEVKSIDICEMANLSSNCEMVQFNKSIFTSTIISEWNLICSREVYVELSQMILMLGFLVGCFCGGFISDKFGRKMPLICAIFIQSVASFACTFSPYLYMFIFSRFILGLASGAISVISFVMCIEIVGGKWRGILPIFYHIPYGFGLSLNAGLSYMLRDWRHFHLSISIFSLVFFLYCVYIPESPRWLLAVNKKDDAIAVLQKASRINGRDPTIVKTIIGIQTPEESNTRKLPLKKLLKSRNIVLVTVYLSIQWLIISLCYFTFTLSVGGIRENPFTTMALTGFMSTPGIFVCIYILKIFNRKTIIFWCQFTIGLSMLCLIAFPKGKYYADWPRLLLVGIITFLYSIFIPTLYLHCAEIYPTVARNFGVGIISTVNRIGGMIAPFLLLLDKISDYFLYGTTGSLMIISLIVLTVLPETKNKPLLDTVEQMEKTLSKSTRYSIKFDTNINDSMSMMLEKK